jgi:hypothetical protein
MRKRFRGNSYGLTAEQFRIEKEEDVLGQSTSNPTSSSPNPTTASK